MVKLAVLYTTFQNRPQAVRVATVLLDEGLVACANAFPILSMYDWEGKRNVGGEVGVLLKTTARRAAAAMRRLRDLHPYDVPCIERLPVHAALPAYAAWVAERTAPRAGRVTARRVRPRRRGPRA